MFSGKILYASCTSNEIHANDENVISITWDRYKMYKNEYANVLKVVRNDGSIIVVPSEEVRYLILEGDKNVYR